MARSPRRLPSIIAPADHYWWRQLWLIPALLMSLVFGKLIAGKGFTIAAMLFIMPLAIAFVVIVFQRPKFGFIFFIFYCFAIPGLGRHISGPQFGLGQDGLLVLIAIALLFHRSGHYGFRYISNDLMGLSLAWAAVTILQIVNPERPSITGWFYEMRSATLYWVFSIPIAFMVLRKKTDIDLFIYIVIGLSWLGTLYGLKQQILGTDAAENAWLAAGAHKTHILFGKLRVFSFYTEAGQFGASQAAVGSMCMVLALGPYNIIKRLIYGTAGMFLLYGYLISGTRGALAAVAGAGLTYLMLSKQTKILVLGIIMAIGAYGFLKYTTIGNTNAQIVRLRTSLDPNDPSLMVRLSNQKILRDYLKNRPFGTGVGTIGQWGTKYNSDKFISTVAPDSLYVKIWAMYGIVGFWLWFGIMMYIAGKSGAIIWNTRDEGMRYKLMALSAGANGILICSYGNEVLNQMPSSTILYISWALIWMSTRWDIAPLQPIAITTPTDEDENPYQSIYA
jgi:hypothetical protein